MKRILSLILCLSIIMSLAPAAIAAEEASAELISAETAPEATAAPEEEGDIYAPCTLDTYYETNQGVVRTYDDAKTVLAGTVYSRHGELRFDASAFEGKEFGGSVLSLTVRTIFADSELHFYGTDNGTRENGYAITSFKLSTGKNLVEVAITDYVKKCLERGDKEIVIFLESNVSVITVFSSESSAEADRPKLRIMDEEPYIQGQIAFQYPVVTAAQFKADLANSIAGGHPYMIGKKEDFAKVREYAFGKNEYLTDMYSRVKATAAKYADKEPSSTAQVTGGSGYNGRAAECLDVIATCALVYNVEGDAKFAERAWAEADAFIQLPHWGTYQYIDNNFPVYALALCYDWLYDWMDQAKRDAITTALMEKHFNKMYDMFQPGAKSKYTSFEQFYWNTNNHALLDNTATFSAAMAIADVEPEKATYVMQATFENMKGVVENWYPDGMWYESLGYWGYTGVFMARWIHAMRSALGTDYGIGDLECIKSIGHSPVYGSSSKYQFVVNDGTTESARPMGYTYMLALINGDDAFEKYTLENSGGYDPFACLMFDETTDYSKVEISDFARDKFFRNYDQVTFRDTWDGDQSFFAGMHVQDAGVTHGVMNSGSLALEALGHIWITNPGHDSYGLTGYWSSAQNGQRWRYYFSRAEANSCLVIDPQEDGGQRVLPGDTIDKYKSNDGGAFAISDLTNTYVETAESYKRGVRFDDNRTKFTSQDEVKLYKEQEVYAFYNIYKCNATISEDGKSVTLSKGNRKVNVQIISDAPFELSIMSANPLPTSPQESGNRILRDFKRIAVHYPSVKEFNQKVVFTPYITEEEIGVVDQTITPMDEWVLPTDEIEILRADSVKLDGVNFEEFNPGNRHYTVETLPSTIELSADTSKYDVSYADTEDGRGKIATIKSKESGRIFSYLFELPEIIKGPELIDTSKYDKIAIVGVNASTHDGNVPANTIDGDSATRWSASGRQNITFQLEDKVKADYIGIAFYGGTARSTFFDIEISADRKNWETISASESSGTSDQMEFFELKGKEARYIRLSCFGTSKDQWNSITEVGVYKAK